jgi:hypothetical protein
MLTNKQTSNSLSRTSFLNGVQIFETDQLSLSLEITYLYLKNILVGKDVIVLLSVPCQLGAEYLGVQRKQYNILFGIL